jgi:hypothetical protein
MADRDGNFIPMILTQNELKLINESKLMSPIGWQNNSRRDNNYPHHNTSVSHERRSVEHGVRRGHGDIVEDDLRLNGLLGWNESL